MRYFSNCIIASVVLFTIGCADNNQQAPVTGTASVTTNAESPVAIKDTLPPVTALLQESFNEADTAFNEAYTNALAPIRSYFQQVNAVTHWSRKEHHIFEEVSSEGAEALFYYNNNQLQKIAAWYYGETGQSLFEFYILNGKLALVNEKLATYNRPIYYDSAAMKANNDTELLDSAKTTFSQLRSYFVNGRLLYQVNREDGGAPDSDSFLLAEQQRILPLYNDLLKQALQP